MIYYYLCYLDIVITSEQITSAISTFLESKKESLIKDRYKLLGPLLAQVKQIPELKWANGVTVKEELEKQVVALIGPKDERDVPVKGKVCI
jgi:glutaminyl-tRNA synthetase